MPRGRVEGHSLNLGQFSKPHAFFTRYWIPYFWPHSSSKPAIYGVPILFVCYLFPIYGYPKIDFWISIITFLDTNNELDFDRSIFGYPNFDLWISQNRFSDIQYSKGFLDVHNSIFGYPKI